MAKFSFLGGRRRLVAEATAVDLLWCGRGRVLLSVTGFIESRRAVRVERRCPVASNHPGSIDVAENTLAFNNS